MLILFAASVLSLFLELVVIRWIGTEVNIFAYLQNTILMVCFLSLGAGCLSARKKPGLSRSLVALLILVVLLSFEGTRSNLRLISLLLSKTGDIVVWDSALADRPADAIISVVGGLLASFVLLILTVELFIPIGRIIGTEFGRSEKPLRAYTLNCFGSLIGIGLFIAMGKFLLGPEFWAIIIAALYLPLLRVEQTEWKKTAALLAAIVLVAFCGRNEDDIIKVQWSPYQKIALKPTPDESAFDYNVLVNNFPFQGIAKPTSEQLWNDSRILYDIPPLLAPGSKSMLIIGSGAGNDVVGALRHPLERIVGVEIDPAVINLGKQYNSAAPYSSDRVHLENDDARAYFERSTEKFDLIHIGMLDSHTVGSMTNTRLDHYVYTRESLEKAKSLLKPGGVMTLSFFAQRPYIADRIARALREIYQTEPISFRFPLGERDAGGTMFVVGNQAKVHEAIESNPSLKNKIESWKQTFPLSLSDRFEVTSDDWPYLYLPGRQIPLLHLLILIPIFGLVFYLKRYARISLGLASWGSSEMFFFLMGAAFLLLEVQNISKAAVVLGSTWNVNAAIISGIIFFVIAANLTVIKFPKISSKLVVTLLLLSIVFLYFFDIKSLLALPATLKMVAVGLISTIPMFFSGMLFAQAFESAQSKEMSLGANLLGSLVGGALQAITFVVGVKALLVVVFLLYAMAYPLLPAKPTT